jgi:hypothetical protein
MSALSIQPTYPIFTDIDGQPLENGYIWIGTANLNPQTNPINVYWDAALTIPATQPIRTLAGYPSNNGTPARIYANSDYSILVQNRNGSMVYSAVSATERYSGVVIDGIDAEDVSYTLPMTGAVQTTVEARLAQTVSVKDFGAVGNGVTDDTAALQLAINRVNAAGGGTIFFPTGTYMITMVYAYAGITFEGNGGAILKRPAMQPNFTRMFTFNSTTIWSQSYDSPPVQFRNLILDGNRDNQGPYTAYQQEQSHLIFLVADATKAGRLRAIVDGCTFLDCVADGVSQYQNVDLTVTNCFFTNMFRGGIVCTGGYTKTRASDCVFRGTNQARSIDWEIDGAGFGGSTDNIAMLNNLELNGTLDLSLGGPNSRATLSNITYGDLSNLKSFNLQSQGAQVEVTNSVFPIFGGIDNQIRFSHNVKISNTEFVLTNQGVATGSDVRLTVYATTSCNLLMDNCRFTVSSDSVLTDTFIGVYLTAAQASTHNIQIDGCFFSKDLDYGVYVSQGGNVTVSDSFLDATTGVLLSGGSGYEPDVSIVDCEFGPNNTNLWNAASNNSATNLYVAGQIEAADYAFVSSGANWNYKSNMTVFGTATDPNAASVPGYPGDTYKLKNQPIFGAGATVFWVGSRLVGSPSFTWVPVNRS